MSSQVDLQGFMQFLQQMMAQGQGGGMMPPQPGGGRDMGMPGGAPGPSSGISPGELGPGSDMMQDPRARMQQMMQRRMMQQQMMRGRRPMGGGGGTYRDMLMRLGIIPKPQPPQLPPDQGMGISPVEMPNEAMPPPSMVRIPPDMGRIEHPGMMAMPSMGRIDSGPISGGFDNTASGGFMGPRSPARGNVMEYINSMRRRRQPGGQTEMPNDMINM